MLRPSCSTSHGLSPSPPRICIAMLVPYSSQADQQLRNAADRVAGDGELAEIDGGHGSILGGPPRTDQGQSAPGGLPGRRSSRHDGANPTSRRSSCAGCPLCSRCWWCCCSAGPARRWPSRRSGCRTGSPTGSARWTPPAPSGCARRSTSCAPTGTDLFVVYVDSFDGADGQQWASDTANLSQFGTNDVLLAVADRRPGLRRTRSPTTTRCPRRTTDEIADPRRRAAAGGRRLGRRGGGAGRRPAQRRQQRRQRRRQRGRARWPWSVAGWPWSAAAPT